MKHQFLFFLLSGAFMMGSAATARAEDYAFLTFEQTDGTRTSIAVGSLSTVTIGNGTLTAGATTFVLSDLSKMYFSAYNETTGISGVLTNGMPVTHVHVYNLAGKSMGTFGSIAAAKESLPAGIYVLEANGKTMKVRSALSD